MWSNLAERLKEQVEDVNLRGTMARIGDVVAPPLDSDEEDEYETDDDEEEEEYEYYEEQEEEDDGESLGLRLQHLIDDEEEAHRQQEVQREKQQHEQQQRFHNVRPVLPNEDDDEEEEEITFSSQKSNGNTSEETTAVAAAVNDGVDVDKSSKPKSASNASVPPSPAAGSFVKQEQHFPGALVPHDHHKQQQQHVHRNTERILPLARQQNDIVHSKTTAAATTTTTMMQSAPRDQQKTNNVLQPPPPPPPPLGETDQTIVTTSSTSATAAAATTVDESKGSLSYGQQRPHTIEVRQCEMSKPQSSSSSASSSPSLSLSSRRVDATNGNNDDVSILKTTTATTTERATATVEAEAETCESSLSPVVAPPPAGPPTRIPSNEQNESTTVKTDHSTTTTTTIPLSPPTPPAAVHLSPQTTRTNQRCNGPLHKETVGSVTLQEPKDETLQSVPPLTNEVVTRTVPKPKPTPPSPRQENETQDTVGSNHEEDGGERTKELQQLKRRCHDLEKQLRHAEIHIVELQSDAARRMDEEEEWRLLHLKTVQEEQAHMVEAATEALVEEHQRELAEMKDLLQQECFDLKEQLQKERTDSQRQAQQFQQLLTEAETKVEATEKEKRRVESKQQSSMSQLQQQQERAVRIAEDKLAHTLARLDEREEEVAKLRKEMKELKAATSEHREVAKEAEEEMDELHAENETLQHNLHEVQSERDELNKQLKLFESQKEKMSGLQMELRMLKEERDRERAHRENAAVDAESSQAELVAERDAALSTARDLEHQLTATLADLDIARSDAERITMANVNLQSALEAFQNEREAEMSLLEQQRVDAEQVTAAAHAAAIEATNEANEARMREVQFAADAAVKNVMAEVQELELKLEDSRKENVNLRRSLDEAIHRLQTSQEDVVDRVFMKNILLDWFAKSGKGKRDVLALMASVLHFTEEEKDAIHIGEHSGALGKVVGAVAAPLPPSAADIDHLEGETVREKWVSFLMAETRGEEETAGPKTEPPATTNGNAPGDAR